MVKQLVGCIIFRKLKDDYEFLMLKRIPKKGGFWQYVTGRFEDDQDKSFLEGAYREAAEETSLHKNNIIRHIENIFSFEFGNDYLSGKPTEVHKEYVSALETNQSFIASIDNNIYPEHSEFKWVNFDDAIKLLKWDPNKEALTKLYSVLKQ